MNTTFELASKINANKTLDFADKAILNQIISYVNNQKTFHATNDYLAECWGTNVTAIKRAIKTLKNFGLIVITVDRRKHQQDGKAWYNKRYIQVDFKVLEAFVNGEIASIPLTQPLAPQIEAIQTEVKHTVEDDADEPVMGIYPEQNNEYTRLLLEAQGKTVETNHAKFNHESVLELIDNDETLSITVDKARKSGREIDDAYTSGIFIYIIEKSERYKELYRAIISKKYLANVA